MSGKFTYNNIDVLFDRSWNIFQVEKINNQSVTESISGIQETLEYYNRDLIHLERNFLTGTEVEQLRKWWTYVRDGSSFSLYRDKDFGMEIDFAGKSLVNNNGNSPTFARTGIANVVDPDTGLLTSIATGTARFPDGNFGRGLLIEGEMTNLLTYTEDFSNAAWVDTNITVAASTIPDPEGDITSKSIKLTATADSGTIYQDTATAIGTDSATFSIWLRCLEGTKGVSLQIWDDTGVPKKIESFTVTTEWVRYSTTYINAGADGDNWRAYILMAYSGDIVYAWGTQLEPKKYATSYLKDAGTRNVESCYYALTTNNFNNKQFSISFWFNSNWNSSEITAAYNSILWISESGSSDRLISLLALTDNFELLVKDYEQNTITTTTAAYTLLDNTWYHFVLTIDSTISDGVKIYINGVQRNAPSNSAFIPSAFERLYVGTYSSQYADGTFDDINIWKRVLNLSEIKAIYNKSSAIGTTQNYWSAVKIIEPNFNPIQRLGSTRWNFAVDLMEVLT